MKRFMYLIPLLAFAALAGFLLRWMHLIERGRTPDIIPSVMIGKPAPPYSIPSLFPGHADLYAADLKDHVTLVNIFATWCGPCQAEHPLLSSIKKDDLRLVGIDYKDKPEKARAWLAANGNPYDLIGRDDSGRVAIDFGGYGVPESYLIDKQGVIRYKQIGPLTSDDIENKILPMARELTK